MIDEAARLGCEVWELDQKKREEEEGAEEGKAEEMEGV
jgi:hypothetical protein